MSIKAVYIEQPYDEFVDKYLLWKGNYSQVLDFIHSITIRTDLKMHGDLTDDQKIQTFKEYLSVLGETNIIANIKEFIVLWNRDRGIRS
jgi:hypothetical protein